MDKVKTFLRNLNDRRKAFRLDHKLWHDGLFLALVCILTGFVWGAYVRGAIAAPLTCDLTNGTLTCPIAGTPTPPVIPPVVPPGGGGGDFAGCPAGSITHKVSDGTSTYTFDTGSFDGQIASVRFVTPASTTSNKTISLVEYQGSPTTREMVIATKACSFAAGDVTRSAAGESRSVSTSPGVAYQVTGGAVSAWVAKLPPNTPYYVNFRNVSCGGDCPARLTLRR